MNYVHCNINGKIRIFVKEHTYVGVICDTYQYLSLQLTAEDAKLFLTTVIYAKINVNETIELWDSLYTINKYFSMPWLVGVHFNVIRCDEGKIGGLPAHPQEYEDVSFCINS